MTSSYSREAVHLQLQLAALSIIGKRIRHHQKQWSCKALETFCCSLLHRRLHSYTAKRGFRSTSWAAGLFAACFSYGSPDDS